MGSSGNAEYMGTVFDMGRILLLVISTALAAPQGNFSDNSDITMDGVILERSAILDRAINTCGCAPVSSTNRIVGGKEGSPKGKLPYQVMFYPCTPEGMCGLCGGTIVNKKLVVTAAHCWDSRFTNLRVIVGEHSICDGINEGGKVINVKKGTMHPNYNKKTMDNDIAVLELSEELTFTDKIKPACLPSSATKDFSGTASTISGWGGTIGYGPKDPQPKQPQQCGLKETMVKVLAGSDSKCSRVLGTSSSTIKLCAWSKDTDTCQGDNGGPLTVPENGKYTLVGGVAPPPLRESTLEFKGSYPGSRASSQAENVLEAARQEEQPLHCQEEQPLGNRPLLRRPPLHLPMATMTTTPTTANPETFP